MAHKDTGAGDETTSPAHAAPGHPGIAPRWTSSAKNGVGTAVGPASRVWFTISHGIVNEVYYPGVDQANTRDMGFIVTDGESFFSEEKRDTTSRATVIEPGVLGYEITNTCCDGRYRIIKTIITDPERDVLLQHVRFEPLRGSLANFRLYALLAPHLANQGFGNDGWFGDYKGVPMLFAERGARALALACSAKIIAASCGYAGTSDGWQQLHANNRLVECYTSARNGNIALTAEVDLEQCGGSFVMALGFGASAADAGQLARAGLMQDFGAARDAFVAGWKSYHRKTPDLNSVGDGVADEYRLSVAILQGHEDKQHPGALIASLSIPWGGSKGDHDLGGYHLVWPRDLVQSASALLSAGHADSARYALHYLMITQNADGHWAQNMWLDGTLFWNGSQLDETALPILLADQLRRSRALAGLDPWQTIRTAASYIVRNGPATAMDRWEEDGGYTPFTLAVCVAALLAASDFAKRAGDAAACAYFRETADTWNQSIERWTYVTDAPLARLVGVDGYYVRIAPRDIGAGGASTEVVSIKNRGDETMEYKKLVSPDALALVRFGVRSATDPRIVNTVRVIDHALRSETSTGPVWHRYNDDGYGEHADGSPFDGTGIGRGWPLLAGERGHYELAAGDAAEATRLLGVMLAQANDGGLIPEQVWDAADIPRRELRNGHPSGSAMPLAWAHAEYVKLARSIRDGRVVDLPPQTTARYVEGTPAMSHTVWRIDRQTSEVPANGTFRIETLAPCVVHWTNDNWRTTHDTGAVDTTVGVWCADLPSEALIEGADVRFTLFWSSSQRWEGRDYTATVTAPT